MHSHHSHSGAFCKHAAQNSSPESMINSAIEKGFTHYNLSEHIPRSHLDHLYPEEIAENLTPKDLQKTFDRYIIEARRCQSIFADKIEILVGAELENINNHTKDELDFIESILRQEGKPEWRIDYLVGSVHHVNGIPIDFDKDTFEKALIQFTTKEDDQIHLRGNDRIRAHLLLMIAYLDAQYTLIQRFKPEVVGHFDLCRLFEKDTSMTLEANEDRIPSNLRSLLAEVDSAVKRNVKEAISYGALFEINTASIRKGWHTPYPGEDVLDIILAQNGRLCLSDDAHSHEQLGLNYHKAYEILKRKGVTKLWYLTKKETNAVSQPFSRGTYAAEIPLQSLEKYLAKQSVK